MFPVFSNARRVLSQCNTLLTVKYHDDLRNLLFEKIIERDRPLMKFDHVKSYFFIFRNADPYISRSNTQFCFIEHVILISL